MSAGSSTTRIRRRPDLYRATTPSLTPLDNYSDTLYYDRGADRTGTVSQRLSDFSSHPPNQLALQHWPAGQAPHSTHLSLPIQHSPLRYERKDGSTPLWPAGTALIPRYYCFIFQLLGTSLSFRLEILLLLRYHVRLACAYPAF